jgi:hypothetical protein
MTLLNNFRIYGHFVEQPNVIRSVGHWAAGIGGAGGIAALTAADTLKAPPDERRKILTRDALVLGSTALGTVLAAHKLMPLPTPEEAKVATNLFIREVKQVLNDVKDKPALYTALEKDLEQLTDKAKLSRADFRNIITKIEKGAHKDAKQHLAAIFEGEEDLPGFGKELWAKLIQKGDVSKGQEEGEVRKMGNFFAVGGVSVLSGLLGGIAANKVNGVKDPDATVNMFKEGIFQFVANIALCAVGAAGAIVAMSHKPIAEGLAKMGMAGKAIKTAGIGGGLSLGIFGGGVIANKLGHHVVNPLCDKLQGKAPQPVTDPKQGKRKIEFWDAILHLDDVPTALALAGMEIVEPFIPLFFGFSGYRTGIGYRNDAASAHKGKAAQPFLQPSQPMPANMASFGLSDSPVDPKLAQNQNRFYA